MRQWRDCSGTPERQGALIEALSIAEGNKVRAAKLLGLSRQHLYRILEKPAAHGLPGRPGDSVTRGDSVTKGDKGARNGPDTPRADVTRSLDESLTYRRPRPTLGAVTSADLVNVHIALPRQF